MYQTYKKEVADKLLKLEHSGNGKIFEVCNSAYGPVLGFRKGKNPKVLLTACHHANEVYNSYQTLLQYVKEGKKDCIIVPVVDVRRFCINLEELKKWQKILHCYSYTLFIRECLHDLYTPGGLKAQLWEYNKKDSPEEIKGLEALIKESKVVIDIHNWVGDSYVFLSNLYKKEAYHKIKKLFRNSPFQLTDDTIGTPLIVFEEEGIFRHENKNSVLSFAAKYDVLNLGVEVPVLTATNKGFRMLNKEKIINFNIKIIDKFCL